MNGDFAEWLKKHRVFSRAMVVVGTVMLWRASEWGMNFAVSSTRAGADIAAIIAAVGVPATFYAGWAFKVYAENKLP